MPRLALTQIELAMTRHVRLLWVLATIAFILPMSVYAMLVFVEGSDFLGIGGRSAHRMLDHTAMKPHVFRQMVPAMARGVIAITPQSVATSASQSLRTWLDTRDSLFNTMVDFRHHGRIPTELNVEHLYGIAVLVCIDWLFMLAFIYYTAKLACLLYPQQFSVRILAAIFALLCLPPFSAKFAYVYDYPVLFFSAYMSCLLIERRIVCFTIMIAIATFNKETSIYLWALFVLYGYKALPRQQWLFHSAVQLLLIISVKAAITFYYSGNVGEFLWTRGLYDHILTNLDGYPVYSVLGLMFATMLIGHRWRRRPYLLKCWVALLPPIVIGWLIFGMRNEYRVMFEIFPPLLVMASQTIVSFNSWHNRQALIHC